MEESSRRAARMTDTPEGRVGLPLDGPGVQRRDVASELAIPAGDRPVVTTAIAGVEVRASGLAGGSDESRVWTGARWAGVDRHGQGKFTLPRRATAVSNGTNEGRGPLSRSATGGRNQDSKLTEDKPVRQGSYGTHVPVWCVILDRLDGS